MKPLIHGTVRGFTHHKCRCDKCRAAEYSYQRWRRKIGRSIPITEVDHRPESEGAAPR